MNQVYDCDYTHSQAEFEEMQALLVNSYATSTKPFNWRLAVLENWNHASRYLEPLEYFTSRVHLWRNDTGELVSFLIRDHDTTHLQVHPTYRFLEASMLDWAEHHWAGDKARIQTLAYDHDTERQTRLARRGYQDLGAVEDVRVYDLDRTYPEPVLPSGFCITTIKENGDHAGRIALENAIWQANLDEAWFRGKSSAPHYSFDWDLVIVSPESKQVAACLVWIDRANEMAEIDPLGTHPDYRGRGLARALVLDSFRRMRASGMRYAYIASESDNRIVRHLYESLQPIKTYQGHRWIKKLD